MNFDAAHIVYIFQGSDAELCPFLNHPERVPHDCAVFFFPEQFLSSTTYWHPTPIFPPPLKTSEELQPLTGGENLALLL